MQKSKVLLDDAEKLKSYIAFVAECLQAVKCSKLKTMNFAWKIFSHFRVLNLRSMLTLPSDP